MRRLDFMAPPDTSRRLVVTSPFGKMVFPDGVNASLFAGTVEMSLACDCLEMDYRSFPLAMRQTVSYACNFTAVTQKAAPLFVVMSKRSCASVVNVLNLGRGPSASTRPPSECLGMTSSFNAALP